MGMQINKYKQIQTNTNKYKQIQTNTNKYKQIQTNTNKYKQIQTNTNKHKQTQTYTNKYIHLYKQIHTKLDHTCKKTSDAGDNTTANFLDFTPNLGIFRSFQVIL